MAHIKAYFPTIRAQNNKKDSKINPSLRHRRIIHENNHARNKRFQLPAFQTANQILWHCSNSQSALRPKSGRNKHKRERVCIRPNFSFSRWRECMRTAKIAPDLRLEWMQFVLKNCETDCQLSEVCMIKTAPHSTLSPQTWCIKSIKGWFARTQICWQDFVK